MAGTLGTVRYRSGSAAAATAATSLSVAIPSGLTIGDTILLVLGFAGGTGVTITPPSGWELVHRTNDSTTAGVAVYSHRYLAASVTPVTFTFTSAATVSAVLAYGGVDQVTVADDAQGQANGASTSCTAPTTTSEAANCAVLHVGLGETGAVTSTPPSGYKERVDQAGAALALAVSESVHTSIGAVGTVTSTLSASVANIGIALLLFPSQLNSYTRVRDEGNWAYTGWATRFSTEAAMNVFVDGLCQRANALLRARMGASFYAEYLLSDPWSTLIADADMDLCQVALLDAAIQIVETGSDLAPAPFLGSADDIRKVRDVRHASAERIIRMTRTTPIEAYFAVEETTPMLRDLFSHVDGISEAHDDTTDNN